MNSVNSVCTVMILYGEKMGEKYFSWFDILHD